MDLYDYSGQHSRSTNSDYPNLGGDTHSHSRHPGDHHQHHSAKEKLHSEAADEWHRKSEAAHHTPLAVGKDGTYVVGHGDCLSTIAERRLRKDGEHISGKSIERETERLRELNADRFPSLRGQTQKQRDFLADGWKLKLYDGHQPHAQTHRLHGGAEPRHHDMPPAPYPQPIGPNYNDKTTPNRPSNPGYDSQSRAQQARADGYELSSSSPGYNPQSRDQGQYGETYSGQDPYIVEQPNIVDNTSSQLPPSTDGAGERKSIEPGIRPIDRASFYNSQKHSYDCGPTALGMAIGDCKLGRPPTDAEVNSLTRSTGTGGDGLSDWQNNLPRELKNNGLNAQSYAFRPGDRNALNQLDQELALGHSAIVHVNNPLTGNGHFIYVAGKSANGGYIIGDPNRRSNRLGHDQPISRDHLEEMMVMPPPQHPQTYKGTPGFTAVW